MSHRTHYHATALVVACLALAACHQVLTVEYECNPAGASLYETGSKLIGTCPVQLTYPVTAEDRANGYMLVKGLTAIWNSGAQVSTSETLRADLSLGYSLTYTLERPRDVAGYETDAEYGLRVTQSRAELAAQQEIADQARQQAIVQALTAPYANRPQSASSQLNYTPYVGQTQQNTCYCTTYSGSVCSGTCNTSGQPFGCFCKL